MCLRKTQACTDEQIAEFWMWFEAHESGLYQEDGIKRAGILREARQRLQALFPAYPKDVDLSVMPNGDRWELGITHGVRRRVKMAARHVRVLMPATLQGTWSVELYE